MSSRSPRQAPVALPSRRAATDRTLGPEQAHHYTLTLREGEGAVVGCQQKGIDVVLRLHGPDGALLQTVDEGEESGWERLAFVAPKAGTYQIEVTPFLARPTPGAYQLWLERRLPPAQRRQEKLQQSIALLQQAEGPGAAVGVFLRGKLVYKAAFGLADLEHRVPITLQTVFHTASVSKQFTAFAVGVLEQQGKLAYDDPVRQYLPELHDFGMPLTIRQLLNHTSGLRDQWELLAIAGWRLDDVITQSHLRRTIYRQRELNFPPGTQHLYSNTGYTLLAELVERVAKESLQSFLSRTVFTPLKMSQTRVHSDHQELVPNRAFSYGRGARSWELRALNYANQGATSLFSTVEDLGRWLDSLDTHQIGGKALHQAMETPGTLTDGRSIGYGFGLSVGSYRGLRTVGHSGADAGFRTATLRFPEQRLAVVVLSNDAAFAAGELAYQLATPFLEGAFSPPPTPPAREPQPTVLVSQEALQRYVGSYRLRENWWLDIQREGTQLWVQANREERFPMRAESEVRFFVPAYNAAIVFTDGALLYQGITAPKVPPFTPSTMALAAYAGSYRSPELETVYTLVVREGGLVAEHPRNEPIPLTPRFPEIFEGSAWFFRELQFLRGMGGAVTGFLLSGGRVRALRFLRQNG